MTFFKAIPTVFCMALLSAMISPSAKADENNHKICYDRILHGSVGRDVLAQRQGRRL